MNIKELKKQAIIEASNLKKHATKEELSRLDFKKLRYNATRNCIYGQMTGDCYSGRASNLIKNCTPIYYEDLEESESETGTFIDGGYRNFSPIELYISLKNAQNEVLIDYLKGKRNRLTVKDL